jgi:hypothetical protein
VVRSNTHLAPSVIVISASVELNSMHFLKISATKIEDKLLTGIMPFVKSDVIPKN